MIKNKYISLTVSFCLLLSIYVYKTGILFHLNNKNYKILLEEKYSKYYEETYSTIYEEKYSELKNNYISNQCVKNKIPKITGLLETAQYLKYTNNSLVRFGDGEISLMERKGTFFQRADKALSIRLREVFKSNEPSLCIAVLNIVNDCYGLSEEQYRYYKYYKTFKEWILKNANYSKQYFDAHISSPFIVTNNTSCELVDLVYKELRDIWRDKNIVILRGDNGEHYSWDVFDTAKSQKVYFADSKEAWIHYEKYKNILMNEDKDKLFILSIGPTSKVLAYDLVKEGRRVLDTGHLAKDYNCFINGTYDNTFYIS